MPPSSFYSALLAIDVNDDFRQIEWDADVADDCRQIVRLAIREDLDRSYDWTTVALVPQDARGSAKVVARGSGVLAGLPALQLVLDEFHANVTLTSQLADGEALEPGETIAVLEGAVRDLLTAERTLLNLLGRLSGIATLTRRYVEAVAGTKARIYDTRKTTPAWRRLEKYAVRCGGGHNHRLGLFDAVLIKDNHLAFANANSIPRGDDVGVAAVAAAVRQARKLLQANAGRTTTGDGPARVEVPSLVEVEVDTLDQLAEALPAGPDIVLLDNMSRDDLRSAVAVRDATAPGVELEASGGVTLATVAELAATGVERISVGALTHAATSLDVALDWALDWGRD